MQDLELKEKDLARRLYDARGFVVSYQIWHFGLFNRLGSYILISASVFVAYLAIARIFGVW